MPKLRITIVSAENITAVDSNGLSDPYIKFMYKGEKFKTTVKKDTLFPQWNETFILDWDGKEKSLNMELWDANSFSRNKKICDVDVKLKSSEIPSKRKWKFSGGDGYLTVHISEHKHEATRNISNLPTTVISSQQTTQSRYYTGAFWHPPVQPIYGQHAYEQYPQPPVQFETDRPPAYDAYFNPIPTGPPTGPPPTQPPPPIPQGIPLQVNYQKQPFSATIEDIHRYRQTPIYAHNQPCLPVNNVADFTDPVPRRVADRYKALIIGINYTGIRGAELSGCVLDAERIKYLLITRFGFKDTPTTMCLMTDKSTGCLKPTKHNIMMAMQWLVAEAEPGDSLMFHFSGHGAQVPCKTMSEADGLDETILPLDFRQAGQIVDDDIFRNLVYPLPSGVKLTAIMDCCHSGTGLDLSYSYDRYYKSWRDDECAFHAPADVIMIAGCEDHDTSSDCKVKNLAGGALTSAFYTIMSEGKYTHTYTSLMQYMDHDLMKRKVHQKCQLSASQKFHPDLPFSFADIRCNKNQKLGRFKTLTAQHKKKRKKTGMQMNGGQLFMAGAMGLGLGLLAGLAFD